MTPTTPPPGSGGGDDSVTLGEVIRRLADVQSTVHVLSDKLDRDYVRASEFRDLERRLVSIESTRDWLQKIVLSAVVLALLGLVLTQGGVVPK